MPTYDYKCENDSCNHQFEIEQRISEDHLTLCPNCGTSSLIRLIGRTGFVLQGGGWAKDRYSNSK